MTLDDLARFRRHPDAAAQALEHEALLVHLGRGATFRLNGSGLEVWRMAEAGMASGEMFAKFAEIYRLDPAAARRDVEGVLTELEAQGLLERTA